MALAGKRVCVIGSGISGLSSAWLCHRNGAHVTLLEKEPHVGGHTLTDSTSGYPIDVGFQVYNLTTYPNLVGFFETLGVDTEPSDMSFALSIDDGKLEWGSDGLNTIFAQRKNLLSPVHWGMVLDVIRFGKEAPKVLQPALHHTYCNMTLGQYLQQERYSPAFINNYVLPMCAAVWSVPNAQVLQFPVIMLVRFWVNHHLLDIFQRPLWRVVKGRSQQYAKRVCAELPDVRTSCGVAHVTRAAAGASGPAVTVVLESGEQLECNAVVFATHSDITLRILGDQASAQERQVLEAVPYNENDVYLHTDASLMPVSRKVWSSWNFMGSSKDADTAAVCVSYWVNRLQHLPDGAPDFFVTLNPPQPPEASKVVKRWKLAHPVFSSSSWEAQTHVADLQGKHATYFAGAWCGYGFHEDGIKSAVAAVQAMGGTIPWTCISTSPKMTLTQQWFLGLFDRFAQRAIKVGYVRLILPNGSELVYGDPAHKDGKAFQVPADESWRGQPAPCATLRVLNMDFFRKVVMRHDTGLGEAYMDKDFEVDNVGGLMACVVANAYATEESRGALGILNWIGDRALHWAHLKRANTIAGSRKNIEEHYDAGNAMYRVFLDQSMMYSSAIHHADDKDLYQAQMRKLDAVIDAAGIKQGDCVLEVGCGWGAFAIRAVQRTGCHVTGLTLSKEQLAEANARVEAAGLTDNITLLFCDYRDFKGDGQFDKVVSIEMIEAVGHENLPAYFSVLSRMLKPGGTALLQAICCPDDRYEAYCRTSDFIREHIFPGGHLPCVGACVEACRDTGLSLHTTNNIGPHYAVTLRKWRHQWEQHKQEVLKLGYSEQFWRKYRFYFAYCEAGFDYRYIHNFHLKFVKDAAPELVHGGAHHSAAGVAASASAALTASAAALQRELPSDPVTQALLALYFFLVGMMVRGHRYMWILPVVSSGCAVATQGVHHLSCWLSKHHLLRYQQLSNEGQAWWCADIVHLAFSVLVSMASLLYLLSEPRALWLHEQPTDTGYASVIVACATGFCAYYLWLCVRYRLVKARAMGQYTTLLLMCGVALYKSVALPFLAVSLCCETSSVFMLSHKLLQLAGSPPQSRVRQLACKLEQVTLIALRCLPHAAITVAAALSPAAFGHWPYYAMALLGMVYLNSSNLHRARLVLLGGHAFVNKQHAH